MNELTQAKIHLYSLLLKKENSALSDAEINVMYELASDRDIQDIISEKVNKERKSEPFFKQEVWAPLEHIVIGQLVHDASTETMYIRLPDGYYPASNRNKNERLDVTDEYVLANQYGRVSGRPRFSFGSVMLFEEGWEQKS